MDQILFPGQQEGERVLYIVRPHWLRRTIGAVAALVPAFALYKARYFVKFALPLQSLEARQYDIAVLIICVILFLVCVMWSEYTADRAICYITDRRFVRFETRIPGLPDMRSLFWSDISRAKSYAWNFLFAYFRIGVLKLEHKFQKDDITVPYVFYAGDLANYIDKLIYTYNTNPSELSNFRSFVTKPAGKRF